MAKIYLGIREIAKLSGVSVATVSRAINTPEKVSPQTLQQVQKVISEYNYTPNIQAKEIFSQQNRSIAIFVLDLNIPFFTELIRELSRISFNNNYTLLIFNTENDAKKEEAYLQYCLGTRTKGIIITEGSTLTLDISKIPKQNLVFHDRFISSEYSSVLCDNSKGIKQLVDYLYNLNHRNFAFIGESVDCTSIHERQLAFINALKEKDIDIPDCNIIRGDWTQRTGVIGFDKIYALSNKPTAIVCANDAIARGFITRANKLHSRIPEDFSIVGFDGVSHEYFYPHITTIKQNIKQIAKELFKSVTQERHQPRHIVLDVEMVIGDSCRRI